MWTTFGQHFEILQQVLEKAISHFRLLWSATSADRGALVGGYDCFSDVPIASVALDADIYGPVLFLRFARIAAHAAHRSGGKTRTTVGRCAMPAVCTLQRTTASGRRCSGKKGRKGPRASLWGLVLYLARLLHSSRGQ